jgi:hypothetical protein
MRKRNAAALPCRIASASARATALASTLFLTRPGVVMVFPKCEKARRPRSARGWCERDALVIENATTMGKAWLGP